MKQLIFIDNDHEEKAKQNLDFAYRQLKYSGDVDLKKSDLILIQSFHTVESDFEDKMFDVNNVIITWSMFTDNHFGSYTQLCDFMVMAGLQELKDKIYIDTATYLKNTLTRAIEHYNQAVFIIRCIENNFIIHYDEEFGNFSRLRFDVNSDTFLKNEHIDISSII